MVPDISLLEDDFFCAARSVDRRKISLWSLVLSAVRIPHGVSRQLDEWCINVPRGFAEHARREIEAFEEENRNWPPRREKRHGCQAIIENRPPVALILGALILFQWVTGPWSWNSEWFREGALSALQVREHGEWWRLITALTLHADMQHLLGNVVFGGLLAFFLCRLVGSGLGWLLIILAGFLGNGISVLLRGADYQSVGFSTSVFGMVGILSGLRLRRLGSWHEVLLALGAALALLALLGTEGERTDLGAHLWGLLAGMGLGVITAGLPVRLLKHLFFRWQWAFFLASLILVIGAWFLALNG